MKDAIFAAIPIVCAIAFGWAFDAWDAERKKRKEAESLRDFFKEDARQCVKLLREANAVLVDLANAAGECGRCLLAWSIAVDTSKNGLVHATDEETGLLMTIRDGEPKKGDGFDMAHEHDMEAVKRAGDAIERFHEYAKRNNIATAEREGRKQEETK